MPITPEQRSLQARAAAYARLSRYDSRDLTAAARRTFLDRFEREVDPEGVLRPAERARRAEYARKAYMTKLSFLSSKARAKRKAKG